MKDLLQRVTERTKSITSKVFNNKYIKYSIPAAIGAITMAFGSCSFIPKEFDLYPVGDVNPTTLYKGESAAITLDEEYQSPFVSSYIVKIDEKSDGIIDKKIESESPINENYQFNQEGTATVYFEIKDKNNKRYTISPLEVRVKPKDSPTLNFYTDASSLRQGEYANFKVDGTDPQSDIVEYLIEIDEGDNGSIEETISSTLPLDINRKFYSPKVRIHSSVKDLTSLKDEKSTLIDLIKDLDLALSYTKESYKIGDQLTYSFSATNVNPSAKVAFMDNTNKDSLKMDFTINNILDPDFSFNLNEGLKVIWNNDGMIGIDFLPARLKFKINEGCSVWTERFPLFWFDGPMSYSYPLSAIVLAKTGNYRPEVRLKYTLDGEEHTIYSNFPSIEVTN